MSAFEILARWPDEPPTDDTDSSEDRVTTAELLVRVGGGELLGVIAADGYRPGPRVSAYRFAEWLVWYWWRLRWESRPASRGVATPLQWSRAHETAGIRGAWLWPRMVIESDGRRVALRVSPTTATATEPLAYVGRRGIVSAEAFEAGIDAFVASVLQRLADCELGNTELHRTYAELQAEREDPEVVPYRRLEALLGYDVDAAPDELVRRVGVDGELVGPEAMCEVVADHTLADVAMAADLGRIARRSGYDACVDDGVQLRAVALETTGRVAPWIVGVKAAARLREQERLGGGPVSDDLLARAYGVSPRCFERGRDAPIAYALRQEPWRHNDRGVSRRVVLRASMLTGRRFEVARLLADRLLFDTGEALSPATRAATFRQKAQRAFAAEFLCPFEALRDALHGDCSQDAMEAAARCFRVSPLVVGTHLANHGLIEMADQDEIDGPSMHLAMGGTVAA